MNRRIATISAGIIFSMLLIYTALCFRAFFRKPAIAYEAPIPDQAREAIIQWHRDDYNIPTQRKTEISIKIFW